MLKLVDNIQEANCITHNGTMHADEVFATAFLELYLKDIRVKRISNINPKDFGNEVIIYDIGRDKFDHHQENAKKRENDITYSSFGLLWQEFGLKYLKQENIKNPEEVFLEIDKDLVEGIDAIDNGLFPKIESSYKVKTLSDIIKLFNPSFHSTESSDVQFKKAVSVAQQIFIEELYNTEGKVLARKIIVEKLKEATNNILILDEYMPYEETILKSETGQNILFVIFPSNRGGYAIKTISKSLTDKTNRIDFPKEWGGLSDEKLEQLSGVKGATFCHNNLFIATCKTKKAAIELAEKVISNNKN